MRASVSRAIRCVRLPIAVDLIACTFAVFLTCRTVAAAESIGQGAMPPGRVVDADVAGMPEAKRLLAIAFASSTLATKNGARLVPTDGLMQTQSGNAAGADRGGWQLITPLTTISGDASHAVLFTERAPDHSRWRLRALGVEFNHPLSRHAVRAGCRTVLGGSEAACFRRSLA
jgi:hypothetical protein